MKRILSNLLTIALLLLSATSLSAQELIKVSGTVTSAEDTLPLIGVSVISGPNSGVTTGIDGTYSIAVSAGTKLRFQYIGFAEHEWLVPEGASAVTHDVVPIPTRCRRAIWR